MAEPIVELIAANLAAAITNALPAIRTAAGLTSAEGAVERPKRLVGESRPAHGLIVIAQEDMPRAGDPDYPGNPNAVGYKQPFGVYCGYRPGDDATVALDTMLNRFAAAVAKAIMADPTRGGNAIGPETEIEGVEYLHDDPSGTACGAMLRVAVTYRVSEKDWTQKG